MAIHTPPKNILIADQDSKRCLSLAMMVKRLEYNAFVATNSIDLARVTAGIIPHLLLLDLDMPGIGAKPCLATLRANRTLDVMKIITMGASARSIDLERTLSSGAGACLTRPISPTELYRTVQKLIEPSPRQFVRIKVIFKATVMAEATGRATFATALSEQGVFIRTRKPFPTGTKVKVALELPSPKPLVLDGEVLYVLKGDPAARSEPGMGIKFEGLDQEVGAGLRRFIEDHIMGECGGWLL